MSVSLDAAGRHTLAAELGDSPATVIAAHLLRHGLATAYVQRAAPGTTAVVVRNLAFNSDELISYGQDAAAIWEIIQHLPDWTYVLADGPVAQALGDAITLDTGRPVRRLDDVYHVLASPTPEQALPGVRLLTPADAPLLTRLPPDVWASGYATAADLLRHGIVAAAIRHGEIVSLARTTARTPHHADLGVETLPRWRGQGLARATAALVANRILLVGQTPVWSAGATNAASLRVAARLRFVEAGRRTYVIPDA